MEQTPWEVDVHLPSQETACIHEFLGFHSSVAEDSVLLGYTVSRLKILYLVTRA